MSVLTSSRLGAAAVVTAALLLTTACGSSGSGAASGSSSSQAGQSTTRGGGQGPGGGGRPGTSGAVVDVSGSTAQVQSQGRGGQASGQTAVTWNTKTTFTRAVTAALSDVSVGTCVAVTSASSSSGGSSAASTPSTVAATSIRITPATKGSCAVAGQRGKRGQGRPSGGAPSGAPSGMRSGGPQGGGQQGQLVLGKVTAVRGSTLSVSAAAPGSTSTSTVSVTTSSKTTLTRTRSATAAAVKVGACVNADGSTDSSGNLTATRIAVTNKVGGVCAGGTGAPA